MCLCVICHSLGAGCVQVLYVTASELGVFICYMSQLRAGCVHVLYVTA